MPGRKPPRRSSKPSRPRIRTSEINPEYGDWNGYWDKLATQVAANDAPDIIQMDEKYVREYGDRGALLDLNKLKGLQTSDIDPTALRTGNVNGEMFGLVTGIATFSIAANPALLKSAGVEMPDDKTWSWDDYRKLSQQVSEKSPGVTGTGVGYNDTDLYIWARQHGDRLYDENSNVAIKPETLESFWENLVELSKSGAAPKPSEIIENASASLNQSTLAQGKQAFAGIFNTQLTAYKSSGQDLTLLRLPGESQAGQRGAYYKPSMFWSVSSRTKHQPAAEKFLNFLANSQAAGDVLLTERGIPANTKVRDAIADKITPTDKAAVAFVDSIADEVTGAPPITPSGGSAIQEILARHTSDVLFERTTPATAAQAVITELQSAIRK